MCIIVIKPKGEHFPDDRILSECFKRNPDGAGIMLAVGGRLIIRKGMMTAADFFDGYHQYKRKYPTAPFVLHFRWSTGGGVQPGLCHPFPLDNRKQILMARQPMNVPMAVAHNGIIPRFSGISTMVSDTFLYVKNELAPAFKQNPDFLFEPQMKHSIYQAINGSRLVFLNAAGQLYGLGKFFKYDGIYYSKPIF